MILFASVFGLIGAMLYQGGEFVSKDDPLSQHIGFSSKRGGMYNIRLVLLHEPANMSLIKEFELETKEGRETFAHLISTNPEEIQIRLEAWESKNNQSH